MEKTNNSLSLKLIDFDNRQIENFSAILDLAYFGLKDEWHITDSSHPDFCVFNGAENSASKNIPKNRCFYYLPSEELGKKNKKNAIFHDKLHIPLVHKLIDTLNSSSAKIDTHQDKESFFEMVPLLKKIIETEHPLVHLLIHKYPVL